MSKSTNTLLLFAAAATIGLTSCRSDRPAEGMPSARPASAEIAADIPRRFEDLMVAARESSWHELPIGDIVVLVGMYFSASPYEAGMLDRGTVEELVVSLDSFDCVLLVETALAAARTIRVQEYSFEEFRKNLAEMRYRSGILDGYCSRLHYFSEWIDDNEEKGIVEDVTEDIGGIRLEKRLNFMSTHRASYPRFASNDSLFAGIVEMENRLTETKIFYIPQERIRESYAHIQSGDIIATATNIEGLDVSHTGIAFRDGRTVGFLHASTDGGVKVSPDLQEYVQNNGIQIGIVVARPL